jgi:hypothetical protein
MTEPFKGMEIRLTEDFPATVMEVSRQLNKIFKLLRENNFHTKYSEKLFFKNENKDIFNKQRLRRLTTNQDFTKSTSLRGTFS